jgi:hypothetical protein
MIADIKARLDREMITYNAIRQHNTRETKATNLLYPETCRVANLGDGMVDIGDGRLLSGGLKMVMRSKRIITSSCDGNWLCIGCGTHNRRPAFKTRGEAGPAGLNQAVFLGDQHIPPILPASGSELCIKILRIENGSIKDLVEEFLVTLGNRRFSPGSVIMIFSFSHLCNVGLSAYIEDLLLAEKVLTEKLGKETKVTPLPPMLLGGCDDKNALRSLQELMGWAAHYYHHEECYMEESHRVAAEILSESGTSSGLEWEERRYRLPSKHGDSVKKIWCSKPLTEDKIPLKVRPLSSSNEMLLITTIIAELRQRLALDLDPSPSFDRGLGIQSMPKKKIEYLLVGSSNASRLKDAFVQKGIETALVHLANWRVYDGCTDTMLKLIREVLEEQDPDVVVLQLLDSSIYFARAADGSRMAPVKLDDGKWHMTGAVTVCSQEMQFEHFAALKPILDVIGKKRTIMVTPLPRYVVSSCCSDVHHCIGQGSPAHRCAMEAALDSMKQNLKEYLFNTGRRNVKLMDPMLDLRGMTDNEIWDVSDPVHPITEVYSKLADGLVRINMLTDLKETKRSEDNKRRRADSLDTAESGSGSRRNRNEDSYYTANRGGNTGYYHSYNSGYRGNTTGWRGQQRPGGKGRYPRGAAGGSSYSDRRGGGY